MSRTLGDKGETVALNYLTSIGHQLVEMNYNCRFGEVDIITVKGDVYHFTEVKTVYHTGYHPLEQITPAKIRKLIKTIEFYMKVKGINEVFYSLDAIGIALSGKNKAHIYREENITL